MIKAIIFDCFGVVYSQEYGLKTDYLNRELLEYIKKLKPNYKTALLSNVREGFLDEIFDGERKRDDYFDAAFTSGEMGVAKPRAEAYILAAKHIGVEQEMCVFVDDSVANCKGAEASGMRAILYTDFDTFKESLTKLLRAESL